jgi:MinD-like ATPase involved in chromosome partitioning or flagellar assembly
LVLQSDAAPSEGKTESVKELLLQLQAGGEDRLTRFSQLLKAFEIFLVVNMVKENTDLHTARIIEKVCDSFLSVAPRMLGHLSYDPAIEKAVNQMVPFPVNRENSPAARDLKEIAQTVLMNFHHQPGSNPKVGKQTVSFLGALQGAAPRMKET